MTDSPAVRVPLDPNEQPILDQLLEIRTKLELQRQDKSSYVKSDDILPLYRQVVEQVESLNRIRETKRHEQNRVDTVLDDCFQLISLFYLTLGKNHEPPAIYTIISSTKRLLDHLKEAGFFSPKDLEAIAKTLKDAREIINKGRDTHSASLVTLIEARIEICEVTLHELEEALQQLTPDLRPSYEKLVSVLRSLSGCNTRSKFPTKEVQELDTQLREVEKKLDTGVTEGVTPGTPKEEKLTELYNFYSTHTKAALHPEWNAQQLCTELLNRCVLWEEIIIQKQGKIDERFKELYDKLLFIRNKLEHLQMTHSWSLRETDLYTYQRQLDRVDESRTADGNFVDANGQPADLYAQRTLLYLLRKSYAIIYHLLLSSEPVSEALLPVFNQLTTLRRCLIEVRKHGGVSSPRELYPYSMKLNSIDNMRTDGKFMFGNEVPEGQAAVTALLEECFEIAYELRTEAEEEAEAAAEAAASQAEEQPPQDDNIGDGEMMTKPARPEIPAGV